MIGFHVSVSEEKFLDNIDKIVKSIPYRIHYFQVFVGVPQSYDMIKAFDTKSKCKKIRQKLEEYGIKLVVHGSYVDNPWFEQKKIVEHVSKELEICDNLGAAGLIMHLPSGYARKQVPKVVKKFRYNTPIWLETSANCIEPDIIPISKFPLRFVLDTAHLYSSGIDIRYYKSANKYIETLPREKLVAIHLNENLNGFRSCRDIHAAINDTSAKIWQGMEYNNSGLRAFVELAVELNIPMILERKSVSESAMHLYEEIKYLDSLIKKCK